MALPAGWLILIPDLEILETIPAGKMPEFAVSRGKCSRIMTGSAIPEGTDCIVMVEDTEILDNGMMRAKIKPESRNICYQGEDIKSRRYSTSQRNPHQTPAHCCPCSSRSDIAQGFHAAQRRNPFYRR